MVTSLRASNCRFRNENLLKQRGSEDIGTANSRAQRLSVVYSTPFHWIFIFLKSCPRHPKTMRLDHRNSSAKSETRIKPRTIWNSSISNENLFPSMVRFDYRHANMVYCEKVLRLWNGVCIRCFNKLKFF